MKRANRKDVLILPWLALLALIIADEIETARVHAAWRQACREMAGVQ